jgi:TonB family protein
MKLSRRPGPLSLFSLLCLAASITAAQDTATPTAATPDRSTATTQTQNVPPLYPLLSKRMGEQGLVEIKVLIDAQGIPSKAQIGRSSGFPRLDASALEAVTRWHFQPARRNGVPEAMWASVPINFFLDGPAPSPSDWDTKAAAAVAAHIDFSDVLQANGDSPTRFFVDILPDGTITDKRLLLLNGVQEWDNPITQALDKVRFPPNEYGLIPQRAIVSITNTSAQVTALPRLQQQGTEQHYEGRVAAKIRSNLRYPDTIPGHLSAQVELHLKSDGRIVGRRLAQSSTNNDWDSAVLRAVDRTGFIPRDVDGRVPSALTIGFRPQD